MAGAYTEGGGEDAPPFGLPGSALAPCSGIFICPYDMSHEIRKDRINEHLEKCRLNYVLSLAAKGASPSLVCCAHNDQHYVFAPELMFHEANCEDQWSAHSILSNLETTFNKQPVVTEGAKEQEKETDFLQHEGMREEPLSQSSTVVNPIAVEEFQDPFEFLRKHKKSKEVRKTQEKEDLSHLGAESLLAQGLEPPLEDLLADEADFANGDLQEVKLDEPDVKSGQKKILQKSRGGRKCMGCPSGMTNAVRRAYGKLSARFRKKTGKHHHRH